MIEAKRRCISSPLAIISVFSLFASTAGSSQDVEPAFGSERLASASPKLEYELGRMVEEARVDRAKLESIAGQAPLSDGDQVAVTIYFSGGREALQSFLSERRARVANVGDGFLEAYVPLTALAETSERSDVRFVRTIVPPVPLGASPAPAIHGSDEWIAHGFTGNAVKVGVIDTGFAGYTSLIGTELPAPVAVRCYTDLGVFTSSLTDCESGNDSHGTAVSEAVIDIAPDVSLYLAQPSSAGDLLATVEWMASLGVQVINHSVGWVWSGPGDGTSPFPDSPLNAVENAVSAGIVWINAAGNEALRNWTGAFLDEDQNGLLEFAPGNELNRIFLKKGKTSRFLARWEDVWGGASRDLALFLLDSNGEIVAGSNNSQDGSASAFPLETIRFTPPADGAFFLALAHVRGSAPARVQLQVFSGPGALHVAVPDSSISNPGESLSPGLLAVGATSWQTPSVIENFSSRGPTTDGRVKPDLVGVDQTHSAAAGGPFPGTSQASPHVAGLAALVKEAFSSFSPQEVAEYLKSRAAPRGSGVPNHIWGHGLAQLPPIHVMTTAKSGAGGGSITSDPSGIFCGSVCAANFFDGTEITLTATPEQGSVFDGWSGDPDCSDGVVTMDADTSCVAAFSTLGACPAAVLGCGGSDTRSNDSPGSTNLFAGYSCNIWNYSGPEFTYAFHSPEAAEVTISLSGLSADMDLLVLQDLEAGCDVSGCFADSTNTGLSDESVAFPAQAGRAYHIVVDGFGGAVGTYRISVRCDPLDKTLLADGFETGDTTLWSRVVGDI